MAFVVTQRTAFGMADRVARAPMPSALPTVPERGRIWLSKELVVPVIVVIVVSLEIVTGCREFRCGPLCDIIAYDSRLPAVPLLFPAA